MAKKTFKFRSFPERVASIKLDIAHRIARPEDIPDDVDSCFTRGLEKWRDLNSTTDFKQFFSKSRPISNDFRQVVHHRIELMDLLRDALQSSSPLALPPLLDLVTQLARDLQADFYARFRDFFETLVQLMLIRDADVLESVFACLSYLFKFLWRYMVKEITDVYRFYCRLFSATQKNHIRRFAAESFSFLTRKCSSEDQELLIEKVFDSLNSDETDLSDGIASLFFEIVKGVNNRFHSNTENFLHVLLAGSAKLCDQEKVLACLVKTMERMAEHTRKEHCNDVWNVIHKSISDVYQSYLESQAETQLRHLNHLLHLHQVWIGWRGGSRIPDDPSRICQILFTVTPVISTHSPLRTTLLDSLFLLVSQRNDWTSIRDAVDLVDEVFDAPLHLSVIANWSRRLFHLPAFDSHLRSRLVRKLNDNASGNESTCLFALASYATMSETRFLDSSSSHRLVELVFNGLEFDDGDDRLAWTFCSVAICGVVKESEELIARLRRLFAQLLAIRRYDDRFLCLLNATHSALTTLVSFEFEWHLVSDILTSSPESVFGLQIAVRAVTTSRVGDIRALYDLLKRNLSSSRQKIRLLTLQLLSATEKGSSDEIDFSGGAFDVCLEAQSCPSSLECYRNRLAILRRLSYSFLRCDRGREVALRYLVGSLYVNFSLLWGPLIELIASHASGDRTTFWPVFVDELKSASQRVSVERDSLLTTASQEDHDVRTFFSRFANDDVEASTQDRPDHANYRILLWKAMIEFVDVVESKSKDVVPMFLDFVRGEYFSVDISAAPRQDLTRETIEASSSSSKSTTRKTIFKTLSTKLAVFSKFKNPRGLYKEPEMRKIYTTMLAHRDGSIQRLALDAVLSYRYKHLTPYRDNLTRILNDDTFRDELARFVVDEEASVVADEHREQLMPILIGLLYGRMMKQAGGKSGKQGAMSQRAIVLRFFAGCPGGELAVFIDMMTQPFGDVLNCGVGEVGALIADPTSSVPIKKQQGFLHLCGQLFSIFGDAIVSYVPSLLTILLYVLHNNSQLLSKHRETIRPQFVAALRSTRQLAFTCLSSLFQKYPTFNSLPYRNDILTAAVRPQLAKLKNECIQNPTGLLRLLHTWTSFSIYVHFFDERDSDGVPILEHVFACLSSKDVAPSVVSLVLEIADNLLVRDEKKGVDVVLPHVSTLLKYVGRVVKAASETKPRPALKQELHVLSQLSPLVADSEQSELLVDTLLSLLRDPNRKERVDLLTTVKNLIKNLIDPVRIVRPLSDLFYTIAARNARQVLCETFQSLSAEVTDLVAVADVVCQLNAWEKDRVEDVDFDARLNGFSRASEMVATRDDVSVDVVLPLLNNATFTLLHSEEMVLRDAAADFVSKLVRRTKDDAWEPSLFRTVISDNVVPAIKTGLKASADHVRHEHLGLLASLVRHFPSRPLFREMTALLNDNPDADIFENMRHIQAHRRIRALRDLTGVVRGGRLSPSTLAAFFLPHVNRTVTESKDHNLVNEAVGVIGACAAQFKWSAYCSLLRRQLMMFTKKGENLKLVSKVLVAVLNAFHFDLSSEQGEMTSQQRKIHDKLVDTILPEIQSILTKSSSGGGGHKYGQHDGSAEQEEAALRAPVVLAAVKLLQALPKQTLDLQLPGLVIRLCQTLRSRSRDVRTVARSTLVKIAVSLGPRYLALLVKEMKHLLKKGYQLHVLAYTVHSVLVGLSDVMQSGDMDECLENVIEISLNNLFGNPAEEREEADAGLKIPEAKATHTYDTFELVARFTSASLLSDVVTPLRQKVTETSNLKIAHCVEEVLRRMGLGLQANSDITPIVMLKFVRDVVGYGSSEMKENAGVASTIERTTPSRPRRPEMYSNQLLDAVPGKSGERRLEGTAQASAHVLVEFALHLLFIGVKKQKFDLADGEQLNLLDSFVPLLVSLLQSKHNKVLTLVIKCLSFMVSRPLSQLDSTIVGKISRHIFALLRRYARAGAATADRNQDLVQACFKTMTVMIRDCQQHKVTDQNLEVLLAFIEEDIYDFHRRSTAFPLLKTVLSRRFFVPMLRDVMGKVEELSVRSDSPSVRLSCRQCILQYLLDYELGKKRRNHFDFLVRNLDYEEEAGRESALELLFVLFDKLPQSDLHQEAGYFFVPLASRLINDKSSHCKQLVNGTIKTLLNKIEVQKRDELFEIVTTWMENDEELLHRRLGFQTCGLFVETEKRAFERRLGAFLPIVRQVLEDKGKEEDDDDDEEDEELVQRDLSNLDHLVFSVLTTLGKAFKECRLMRNKLFQSDLDVVWDCVENFLDHSHSWIQLASCRLFGLLFSAWKIDEIVSHSGDDLDYIQKDVFNKVSFLTFVFCRQLGSKHLAEDHGDQIVRNLLFLAELMLRTESEAAIAREGPGIRNLEDLIDQMSKVARKEAGHAPNQTSKRTFVLKWVGALAIKLGGETSTRFLASLLKPVVRELSDKTPTKEHEQLKILSQEVCDVLKDLVGREAFSKAIASAQQEITERRISRKREKALDAVANPEKRARQKIKKNVAKQVSRKRKAQLIKHPAKWKKRL